MQKVLTAEQMREVDRLTTEKYGIPSILLMENAAHAVANVVIEKLGGCIIGESVLILCGKGNNGGDGAALARILSVRGATVAIYLFGKIDETKGDARSNFEIVRGVARAQDSNLYFEENCLIDQWVQEIGPLEINKFDVIVDALFGTGLSRPLDSSYALLLSISNSPKHGDKDKLFVSIDIPSGVSSDSSEVPQFYFRPDITVTFTAPKPANVLPPTASICGELIVADIGSPKELIDDQPSQTFVTHVSDIKRWLSRSEFTDASYKNKRGHALIIAGSKDYTGAAVLCGDAAIRSGVGLTTLAVPEGSRESVVARVSPEVMVRGISETEKGSAAEKAVEDVQEFLDNVDVIAVGSGLSSKEDETKSFVKRIVEERTTPIVIDADGLTALSPFNIKGSDDLPLILTPHEGEFMRLLGTDDKSVISDRVAAVRDFAVKHHVILVLKGERVLIGEPGGKVVINPTGNPGLGKAGNGDTLTGIIAGFAAQAVQMKIDMFETVVAAVYVASSAGDLAEKKFGTRVMTASDVRDCFD